MMRSCLPGGCAEHQPVRVRARGLRLDGPGIQDQQSVPQSAVLPGNLAGGKTLSGIPENSATGSDGIKPQFLHPAIHCERKIDAKKRPEKMTIHLQSCSRGQELRQHDREMRRTRKVLGAYEIPPALRRVEQRSFPREVSILLRGRLGSPESVVLMLRWCSWVLQSSHCADPLIAIPQRSKTGYPARPEAPVIVIAF